MQGWHKFLLVIGLSLFAVGAWLYRSSNAPTLDVTEQEPQIRIWHGQKQRVGHLGKAQDDFNLLGSLEGASRFQSLTVDLNGASLMPLTIAEGSTGFRRLARAGHFNADIPLKLLQPGINSIVVRASDGQDLVLSQEVTLEYQDGRCSLPFHVAWRETTNPQAVGQYVDGEWVLEAGGLRTQHMGYDRIFLIGNETWKDYEVKTSITVHKVPKKTGPLHGGNGVGIIMRFAGHVTGGHRDYPEDQPKWGYQPFGAIGWLRWKMGWPLLAPRLEYYGGDSDDVQRYGFYGIRKEKTYWLRMACETLPDTPQGEGVTRYSFKIWPDGKAEPAAWHWQFVQTSRYALRQGGVGLLAHHVDVTFGDVTVKPLGPPAKNRSLGAFASETLPGSESSPAPSYPLKAGGHLDAVEQVPVTAFTQ